MKIQIHKQDIKDVASLNKARKEIEDGYPCIKSGSLKQRDVTISWRKNSGYITVNSRDITL